MAGRALSCVAGDYDNDGWTDVVLALNSGLRIFHNEGNGTFRDVTEVSGLSAVTTPVLAVTLVDYDHDGDLDLLATAPAGGPMLWRNNGNGKFTNVSADTMPGEGTNAQAGIVTDFDNDRAVDLIVTRAQGPPSLLRNPREGRFQAMPLLSGASQTPTRGVVVFDFDKDGWMDVAFTHAGSPGLSLWRNVEGKRLEPVPLPKLNWMEGWGLAAVDYDNDGWIDLAAVGSAGSKARIVLLRNQGSAGFRDVTQETGLDKVSLEAPGSLIIADYDGDGDADMLITQDGGPPVLLRNDGGNKNNWLRLSLKPLADNRSAIRTKMEVFAGALYQKFEVQSSTSYLGQNAPEILVGLGDLKETDIVRLLWPTGVLQDEVRLEFDSSRLPPVPPGWARDYLLYADGFEKDMDFYAAYGYTVEPLPFHAMRGYPYLGAETYPPEGPYLQYQLEMNTRQVSGRNTSSFRFDYQREPAAKSVTRLKDHKARSRP